MSNSGEERVSIERRVDSNVVGWPVGSEILGALQVTNHQYLDLRRLSWSEAKRVWREEAEFMARIQAADDPEDEHDIIWEELYEEDIGLYGLDLGIASTVVSLSAAGCWPYASCNGGAYGRSHHEKHPLVVFYARREIVPLLMECATQAAIGLVNQDGGSLMAYSNEVLDMSKFAALILLASKDFRRVYKLNHGEPRKSEAKSASQLKLPL